jgi:hypothetical protein
MEDEINATLRTIYTAHLITNRSTLIEYTNAMSSLKKNSKILMKNSNIGITRIHNTAVRPNTVKVHNLHIHSVDSIKKTN